MRRTPTRSFPAWKAASSTKPGVPSRKVLYLSYEKSDQSSRRPPLTQQSSTSPIRTSSLGLATGKDLSNTACTRVKMAVVAPIPSASVNTAVAVKPGALANCLSAYRISSLSRIMLFALGMSWIDRAMSRFLSFVWIRSGTGSPALSLFGRSIPSLVSKSKLGFSIVKEGTSLARNTYLGAGGTHVLQLLRKGDSGRRQHLCLLRHAGGCGDGAETPGASTSRPQDCRRMRGLRRVF